MYRLDRYLSEAHEREFDVRQQPWQDSSGMGNHHHRHHRFDNCRARDCNGEYPLGNSGLCRSRAGWCRRLGDEERWAWAQEDFALTVSPH